MTTVTITNTFTSKTTNGGGGIPPSNITAPVISGSSNIGSVLSTTDGTWAGTAPITYMYQWKRNGNVIVGETNTTYTLVLADYGNSITCEIKATNAYGFSSAISNSITGTGIAPTNTVAPVISGSSVIGSTLTTTTGTWTGTAPITYAYQWKRDGVAISGETNTTYVLTVTDYNKSITCDVKATNIVSTVSATSNSIVCTGVAPSNTVAPVISGSSVIGSTLSSTTGTWIGNPTPTYTYQWKSNGVNILGATSSTYVLTVSEYNKAVTCQVTATNIVFSTSATSNSITCTGVAPANTVAPVISGTPTVGQTLSSTTGTWTGNPTPTYTYQWKRNGSNISGATSSTYTLVQADATFAVTCVVTGTNVVSSTTATSNSLTIFDADAQAYITAATITDTTQKNAVNQLTVDLKAASIWTKMKAVYPFLGGTATTHKWNLKNPLDTNAAYRLTFTGGWTHSSTGALPNGTNGYADTFLNANTALQQFSHHHSFYHNTNNSGTGLRSMGGVNGSVTNENFRTTIETTGTALTLRDLGVTSTEAGLTATTLKGFRASSRIANNNCFVIKADGTSATAGTTVTTNALPSLSCYVAAHNGNGTASNYAIMSVAFHSIGDGLSTAEGLSLRNAVVTFQTTLGRT